MQKKIPLTVVSLAFILLALHTTVQASEIYTEVYVNPPTRDVSGIGTEFTTDIDIFNVSDLCGWEFKLYYVSTVLNGTNFAEGPFLASAGSTYLWLNFTDSFNATHGLIHAACTLIGPGPGANGNGTLATITFKTKNPGDTPLHLQNTIIIDSNENPIPHTTQHGTVHVDAGILGDVNGDGKVDMKDIGLICKAYGSYPGHPRWDPRCDLNNDDKVCMKDIGIACKNYGQTSP